MQTKQKLKFPEKIKVKAAFILFFLSAWAKAILGIGANKPANTLKRLLKNGAKPDFNFSDKDLRRGAFIMTKHFAGFLMITNVWKNTKTHRIEGVSTELFADRHLIARRNIYYVLKLPKDHGNREKA
jgi:hypothetical protein